MHTWDEAHRTGAHAWEVTSLRTLHGSQPGAEKQHAIATRDTQPLPPSKNHTWDTRISTRDGLDMSTQHRLLRGLTGIEQSAKSAQQSLGMTSTPSVSPWRDKYKDIMGRSRRQPATTNCPPWRFPSHGLKEDRSACWLVSFGGTSRQSEWQEA